MSCWRGGFGGWVRLSGCPDQRAELPCWRADCGVDLLGRVADLLWRAELRRWMRCHSLARRCGHRVAVPGRFGGRAGVAVRLSRCGAPGFHTR